MGIRLFMASFAAGLSGSAIAAIWLHLLNTFLVQYPLRSMGVAYVIGLPSGFLACFIAYELYARSGFLAGSLFGALAGTISGSVAGVGFIVASYYGHGQPVAMELFGNGLFGGLIGMVTGAIAGKIMGPLLAKVAKIDY